MPTPSQITVGINGVDNTRRAFNSAKKNSRAFAAGLNSLAKGDLAGFVSSAAGSLAMATAAIGTLAARVRSAAEEMGALSDRAQDAGISSGQLQKLVTAMQDFGVRGANAEMVARAFQEMVKRTGQSGVEGFGAVLGSISQVNDAQQQAAMLADAFGKQAGMAFAPLVANAGEGARAVMDLGDTFYTASDEAVGMGDWLADRLNDAALFTRNVWYQVVGDSIKIFREAMSIMNESASASAEGAAETIRGIANALSAILATLVAIANFIRRELTAGFERLGATVARISQGDFKGAWQSVKESFREEWVDAPVETAKAIAAAWTTAFDNSIGGTSASLAESTLSPMREAFERADGVEFIRKSASQSISRSIGRTAAAALRHVAEIATLQNASAMQFGSEQARNVLNQSALTSQAATESRIDSNVSALKGIASAMLEPVRKMSAVLSSVSPAFSTLNTLGVI